MTAAAVFDDLLTALGPRATRHRPLGPLTTYGVGGEAAVFFEVEDSADLRSLRDALAGRDIATFVIGRGSNVLVADRGFDGVVVRLGQAFGTVALPEAAQEAEQLVVAGAAAPLPVLARRAADAGWSGLTWAVGVPGSVGGAVRMNAGGHGSDMASCVRRYTWVDLRSDEGGTDEADRLDFSYRSSSVSSSQLVLRAELSVTPGDAAAEQADLKAIVSWRRQHQPGGSNAGSVFTNPEGDSAGRLIDDAGLKGFRLGSAQVSEKHANFIQADRDGRAGDVRALMEHVRVTVLERTGIILVAEVRLLGFGEDETGRVMHDATGQP